MLPKPSQVLDRSDWLHLALCLLCGCGVSFAVLQGVLQTVLEPSLIAEAALRNSRSVRLVEMALEKHSISELPPGVRALLPGRSRGAAPAHEQLRSPGSWPDGKPLWRSPGHAT